MSLLSHWQLWFGSDIGCSALKHHCSCRGFHTIVVVVGWYGTVVIETCLDNMPGFIGCVDIRGFVGVGLGVGMGVNGSCRSAVEFYT